MVALIFGVIYHAQSDFRIFTDKAFDPAVAGLSKAYGYASTALYRKAGINMGMVTIPADQDFLFGVRLATYINQRRAGPLLDIAADSRFPDEKRERALLALLKFESTSDWIQPFLNELPKGGLLGMYDPKTPTLNQLIQQIRSEGGVRQPFVRAYAEVVFSFMLQHPDLVIRLHANQWVSDVVAEDALFLLIPRFAKENDPEAQKAIEAALYSIRAVSEPGTARELIIPFYRDPTWPTLKRPLGMILARLGYGGAVEYVHSQLNMKNLTDNEKLALNAAADQTPYPKELRISDTQKALALEREQLRRKDIQAALARRELLLQEDRAKQALIAQAQAAKSDVAKAAREAAEAEAALAAATARKAAEAEAQAVEKRKAAEAKEAALAQRKAQEAQATAEAAKKAAAREAAAIAANKAAEEKAAATQKASEAKATAIAARAAAKAEAEATAARKAAQAAEQARTARQLKEARIAAREAREAAEAEAAAAAASKAAAAKSAAATEAAKRIAPAPIPVAQELKTSPEAVQQPAQKAPEQVAYLPPAETLPPPLESGAPKSKSLMNYVDLVVQVKKDPAALFQNPGDTPTGAFLPENSKGHADFEVVIGEDKWYQVKSKKGNGWVNGKYLSIFNLSPGSEAPVVAPPPTPSEMEGGRKESTYFESNVDNAPLFDKPVANAKEVGTLTEGTPYLAVRSEKVNANRWFLLQIRADETAWARGTDLQLADVQQPNVLQIPTQALSQRGKESAFKAEWITPSVKGVGVYSRPTIAAKMIKQVNPKDVFKVTDSKSNSGTEWYQIELSPKLNGWVQTMDVQLTKKPN